MSVDQGATSYIGAGDLIAAGAVLGALDIVAVALRLYARSSQRVGFGLDDWLILPALLLVIGMAATMIASAEKGAWGSPTPKDPNVIEISLQVEYAFQLLMIGAYGFIKLSVMAFYRRVFVVQKQGVFDIICLVSLAISAAWTIGFFFLFAFQCGDNFSLYWLPATEGTVHGTCLPAFPTEKTFVVSDFITDILVFLMPFPMIWRLHMTIGRKVAVSGILLLGCMSVIASIIRLVYYYGIFDTYYTDLKADLDLTLARCFYWSMIEAGLAIIAACLPTIRFLFGQVALERIVRSVQSAFSLSSLSSRRSRQQTEGATAAGKNEDAASQGSQARIHGDTEVRTASNDEGRGLSGREDEVV